MRWRDRRVAVLAVAVFVTGIALMPVSRQVSVNRVVTTESMPLWRKLLDFVGRDVSFRQAAAAAIGDALERVGLADAQSQAAGTLSAGQRRRLALARVMLAGTPLWILDEPYTNLDVAGTELVSAIIGRHLDDGGAALIAAHQPPAIRNHVPRRLELA